MSAIRRCPLLRSINIQKYSCGDRKSTRYIEVFAMQACSLWRYYYMNISVQFAVIFSEHIDTSYIRFSEFLNFRKFNSFIKFSEEYSLFEEYS